MERRHEPTRLEGFSDAVFGFALTLLVVSLEVPKDIAGLVELMKGFVPFALMFAMICWIWYEHQKFFRGYGLQDAWVIAVNCLLLFLILFYVYPLKFLTLGLIGGLMHMTDIPDLEGNANVVMLAYSSGVVLIFGAFVLLYHRAWTLRGALALSPSELIELRHRMLGHLYSALLGAVSLAMLFYGWKRGIGRMAFFSGIIYALMGPVHAFNGFQGGKAQERLRKQQAADAQR